MALGVAMAITRYRLQVCRNGGGPVMALGDKETIIVPTYSNAAMEEGR